jgi:hypothetical protein
VEILTATRLPRLRINRRMRSSIFAVLLAILVCCAPRPLIASEGFSGARAYAHLQKLAGDIGPRPMGSPAEQQALAYAVSTFAAAGCDTAYVMPMTTPQGVNTTSGIAVGIRKGVSGRMIVIGGHIDSSAPDVAGANDDGSGAACVMELAHVIGQRHPHSTIVFACFGGEEEGLMGSTWFVNHFAQIDSVDMMLQIDMTDGATYFELDPDASFQVSAPQWLPEAAQEIYNAQRGDGRMRYLTHMATLNASTPGGTGSDHMPFLEKGIPALDFTSDIGYPIHSPLDNLATFDSSGMARQGALVLGLVDRFDGGVPSRTTDKYYLVQIAGHLFFFTHPVMYALSGIAVVFAVVVFNILRRRRLTDRAGEPSWSGFKLGVFAIVIQACVWLPETLVGMVKGYRYPWVNNLTGFALLAVAGGVVGLWCVLQISRRWRIGTDPFPLFLRFFILMFGAWFGMMMANPELAFYAAWPLFWISLAVLLRPVPVKAAAFLLGAYLPLRLVFVEPMMIFLRMLSTSMYEGAFRNALPDFLYIFGFGLLSLPLVYGFAAVYRSAQGDLFSLRLLRTWRGGVAAAVAFAALFAYLLTTPVYDALWKPAVRIEQKYAMGTDTTTIRVTGSEGANGASVAIDSGSAPVTIADRIYAKTLPAPGMDRWLTYDETTAVLPDSARPDSLVQLKRVIDLDGPVRPLSVSLRFHSEKPMTVTSPWSQGSRRRGIGSTDQTGVFSWYAFPELPLRIPVMLRVVRGQTVTEALEITYDTLAAPVRLSMPGAIVRKQFTVERRDTLRAPGGSDSIQ